MDGFYDIFAISAENNLNKLLFDKFLLEIYPLLEKQQVYCTCNIDKQIN